MRGKKLLWENLFISIVKNASNGQIFQIMKKEGFSNVSDLDLIQTESNVEVLKSHHFHMVNLHLSMMNSGWDQPCAGLCKSEPKAS